MDITRIPVAGPTRSPSGRTAAYILQDGSDGLLVDPAARSPELDSALRSHSVSHVAATHHHADHVGAIAEYASEADLTVWARAGREPAFERAADVSSDRTFRPGNSLPLSDLQVIETPGHAPEHVAFVAEEQWLTGDLAVAEGSVVVGAPSGDMRAYLTSLRRVRATDPDRLWPAHGPVIDDPRAVCDRLIAHRLDRERAVLAAVRSGAETFDAIVAAAYEKDISHVYDLAAATVEAHLEKLAYEGTISWDGSHADVI